MKLIPLEEVIKLLNEYPSSNTNKIIQSLPEPIDPIATIDEMIEEQKRIRIVFEKSGVSNLIPRHIIMNLEGLKSRLSLNQK